MPSHPIDAGRRRVTKGGLRMGRHQDRVWRADPFLRPAGPPIPSRSNVTTRSRPAYEDSRAHRGKTLR